LADLISVEQNHFYLLGIGKNKDQRDGWSMFGLHPI